MRAAVAVLFVLISCVGCTNPAGISDDNQYIQLLGPRIPRMHILVDSCWCEIDSLRIE